MEPIYSVINYLAICELVAACIRYELTQTGKGSLITLRNFLNSGGIHLCHAPLRYAVVALEVLESGSLLPIDPYQFVQTYLAGWLSPIYKYYEQIHPTFAPPWQQCGRVRPPALRLPL